MDDGQKNVLHDGWVREQGNRVILDRDLARLYGVTTGNLKEAVKRISNRFPEDFMFQLTSEEYKALRFHFGSLEKGRHYGTQFRVVFDAIRSLMAPPEKPPRRIGFEVKEPKTRYGRK